MCMQNNRSLCEMSAQIVHSFLTLAGTVDRPNSTTNRRLHFRLKFMTIIGITNVSPKWHRIWLIVLFGAGLFYSASSGCVWVCVWVCGIGGLVICSFCSTHHCGINLNIRYLSTHINNAPTRCLFLLLVHYRTATHSQHCVEAHITPNTCSIY